MNWLNFIILRETSSAINVFACCCLYFWFFFLFFFVFSRWVPYRPEVSTGLEAREWKNFPIQAFLEALLDISGGARNTRQRVLRSDTSVWASERQSSRSGGDLKSISGLWNPSPGRQNLVWTCSLESTSRPSPAETSFIRERSLPSPHVLQVPPTLSLKSDGAGVSLEESLAHLWVGSVRDGSQAHFTEAPLPRSPPTPSSAQPGSRCLTLKAPRSCWKPASPTASSVKTNPGRC